MGRKVKEKQTKFYFQPRGYGGALVTNDCQCQNVPFCQTVYSLLASSRNASYILCDHLSKPSLISKKSFDNF